MSAANNDLTVSLRFCNGRTTRTIRTHFQPPTSTPMGGGRAPNTIIATTPRSMQFQPPSSELDKNAGFPFGNSILFGDAPGERCQHSQKSPRLNPLRYNSSVACSWARMKGMHDLTAL